MMNDQSEIAALARAERLATARRLASDWGYWCVYGMWGSRAGRKPKVATGTLERRYKAPPMWHPPEPAMPEANEPVGIAVQKAFALLPEVYRRPLVAEFCIRPWVVALKEGELEVILARKAKLSVGSYGITLDRALLALHNVLKRHSLLEVA